MANPAYSILIVETYDAQTQDLQRRTYLFSKASGARFAYETEVANNTQGISKRLFLYEQPTPTGYKRGDGVPFPVNVDTWD